MKVWHINHNNQSGNGFKTELTDIIDVANTYGEANDSLMLYDDHDKLVAIATWRMGWRYYLYCEAPHPDAPELNKYMTEEQLLAAREKKVNG